MTKMKLQIGEWNEGFFHQNPFGQLVKNLGDMMASLLFILNQNEFLDDEVDLYP